MRRNIHFRQGGKRLVLFKCLVAMVAVFTVSAGAQVQSDSPYFARVNTFGAFGAFSGDSSHILLGLAQNRRLLNFGLTYGRRLILNRTINWQYSGELLPVALESDPLTRVVTVYTQPISSTFTQVFAQVGACHPESGNFMSVQTGTPVAYTYTQTCSRQWSIGEGMSPIGMQLNFSPRKRLQPFLIGHAGYMYSTRPIPIANAGSFNFTFDVGAGVEAFHSRTRSVRLEYRYHHISNAGSATSNPGIDSNLVQATYSFGR